VKTLSPVLTSFLRYVVIDTRCIETKPGETPQLPSSPGQTILINLLHEQLEELGIAKDRMIFLGDGSLMVELPADNGCENAPHVVLGAHVDTYPKQSGDVVPIVYAPYQGGNIVLPNEGTIIPAEDLVGLEDKTIVVPSGDSLLGGDDKAGVAEIMVALKRIVNMPHGPLTIIFFTDEEGGDSSFVKFLDPAKVAAWDIFYTLDGLEAGTIDIGCFNGAEVIVTFKGNDAHPGVGGKKIKSALAAAVCFCQSLITFCPRPWDFESNDPDGAFVHVTEITGTVGEATVTLIPRSFNLDELTGVLYRTISKLAEEAATGFDLPGFEVSPMVVGYQSTEEAVRRHPKHIDVVAGALYNSGLKIIKRRVRGGTDGAMLNLKFPQVPCINLGTGDRNCHEKSEFVVVEEMEAMVDALVLLVALYADQDKSTF